MEPRLFPVLPLLLSVACGHGCTEKEYFYEILRCNFQTNSADEFCMPLNSQYGNAVDVRSTEKTFFEGAYYILYIIIGICKIIVILVYFSTGHN